ncbi:hypothetical protein [Sporosarcina newyorkensis]|uniref:Uncharacterized protein n=1 Tax=Sporosarcina newyorkensis TaxID=759851 RepID=A0A1T4XK38_9BACL|nr:hypothetical protein [Sporosarcina newyorkensis]SKA89877.1 hypothetical protein SAMN04244570_0895 [Sporosarcina newyorkensis]
MNGDALVWIVLFLSIVICDYVAVYLYKQKRFPLWLSAIGMALLVPVIVFSFVSVGVSYNNIVGLEPDDTGEGVAFAGGFIAVVLGLHSIIVFVIGAIVSIYNFTRKTQKVKKDHVL